MTDHAFRLGLRVGLPEQGLRRAEQGLRRAEQGLRRAGLGLRLLLALLLLTLAACSGTYSAKGPTRSEPERVEAESLPYIPPGDFYTAEPPAGAREIAAALRPAAQALRSWQDLAPALAASRAYVATREPGQVAVARGALAVTWAEIAASLELLQELLPRLDAEPELLAVHFRWLGLSDGADFSGYYEPVLKASRSRKPGYTYPLYRLPPDLKQADLGAFKREYIGQRLVYRLQNETPVPYYSRAEIDGKGVLRGKGLELAWLADPLDAFFLHVQGSGRLRFTDGTEEPVAFAGTNGRPYLGIGRHLSDLGLLAPGDVSMQSIRAWLEAHPAERDTILRLNQRYVFFRKGPGSAGSGSAGPGSAGSGGMGAGASPVGGMGRPITPWVSLAVDRQSFPLGAALIFAVDLPVQPEAASGQKRQGADDSAGKARASRMLRGIGFAQDTGSAIKGRRVDLFCGRGEAAAYTAGHLNGPGQVWLLLARERSTAIK